MANDFIKARNFWQDREENVEINKTSEIYVEKVIKKDNVRKKYSKA